MIEILEPAIQYLGDLLLSISWSAPEIFGTTLITLWLIIHIAGLVYTAQILLRVLFE